LEEFYPEGVKLFKQMKAKHHIDLPQGLCVGLEDYEFETMIDVAMALEPLWENALGKNWKQKITRDKLKALYQNI
jgi:3-deoxy-alpha-D-manno-octulosonate 8-oxidase